MSDHLPDEAIHLTRRDPARNMARFYRIELLPDLFGGVQLVRRWGRIGTQGRVARAGAMTPADAASLGQTWMRQKLRRGYGPEPEPAPAPAPDPEPCA